MGVCLLLCALYKTVVVIWFLLSFDDDDLIPCPVCCFMIMFDSESVLHKEKKLCAHGTRMNNVNCYQCKNGWISTKVTDSSKVVQRPCAVKRRRQSNLTRPDLTDPTENQNQPNIETQKKTNPAREPCSVNPCAQSRKG
ncbi:hypothetical protein ASPBRDRAFT_447109 [Aspergillus brasiliensis CBS 101740]|uniref:Uncharacterized protein n=1 Tax=Aspergillus brasiliensis (strain CBS 101740 / IMI 381727 / IBT 21946) TaxID=767769 RepID=A0A1L9URL6_ASPBC|nr:hypothetical protein ASPBRDRAFT_447109 [Aspergillus brasiliensis CBS 101740]